MSEKEPESIGSEQAFEKFTKIVMAQNESISRIHLEQSASTKASLDGMVASIDKLTEVQVILTNAHIEAKKDREYDQKRAERLEENQKEQGQEIKHISDTVILLEERTNNITKRWGTIIAVISAVIASLLGAFFISEGKS